MLDKLVGGSHPGRLLHQVERRIRHAVGNIALHRIGKQEDILHDHADAAAQFLQVVIAHIDIIDQDGAESRVIEPDDQVDQRGLARAGQADDADGLAGLSDQADIGQRRLAGVCLFFSP